MAHFHLPNIAPSTRRGPNAGASNPPPPPPPPPSSTSQQPSPAQNQPTPRSRTGCWTCRQRKVKCDENHPECNKCKARKLHCDYGPRLEWKHMSQQHLWRNHREIMPQGCPVWDRNVPRPFAYRHPVDPYPPFTHLANDEERESKASTRPPGKFFVVATPPSFAELPEYSSWQGEGHRDSRNRPYSARSGSSVPRRLQGPRYGPYSGQVRDPDTTFVVRFEDESTLGDLPVASRELHQPLQHLALGSHVAPYPSYLGPQYGSAMPFRSDSQSVTSSSGLGSTPPHNPYWSRSLSASDNVPSTNTVRPPLLPTSHVLPAASLPDSAAGATADDSARRRSAPSSSGISSRTGSLLEEMIGYGQQDTHSGGPGRHF